MASENPKPNAKRSAPANPPASPKESAPKTPPAKPPPLSRPVDRWAFAITSLLVFLGYLYTLAPDLTLEDSGELAVGSYYAGVPHPPGYPVWTIYSWVFTKIIPFSNVAFRVGISSAFAGALACGLIALMVSRGSSMFIEAVAEFKTIERRVENWICFVAGFVAGTIIGFNGFMWSQSVIVEVYSLSMLSLTGVLVCLLRWAYAPHQYRYLYAAWFLCGIAFNNHQSLLVITIAMEVMMVCVQAKLGRAMMLWNSMLFIIGLILQGKGQISILSNNVPVVIIYWTIGLGSFAAWIWLSVKTKASGTEFLRDAILAGTGIFMTLLGGVTAMVVGLGLVLLIFMAVDFYLSSQHRPLGWSVVWRKAINSGLMFGLGSAFYLYMPLASMTNPPLNWGYPRTVAGFIHAFTRGQYERIHPTTGTGNNIVEQTASFIARYAQQTWFILIEGPVEEFNLGFLLLGLIPLFFFRRLQARERAWLLGLVAFYFVLGPFLLEMFNPAPDRQSLSLNKPFFIASHFIIAMAIGYGLTFLLAMLLTGYQQFRRWAMIGFAILGGLALYEATQTFAHTPNPILRFAPVWLVVLAVAAALSLLFARNQAPIKSLLLVILLMPVWSVVGHWSENEQRGHLFGFWFGHDMFTPPFKGKDGKLTYLRKEREELMKTPEGQARIYPEMTKDTILFGGTDPGRFCPTYMIFCESFIDAKDRRNEEFDRRDVYIITQNALADGTYLNYIRCHYFRSAQNDPPFFQDLMRSEKEKELNFKTNLLARLIAVPLDRLFIDGIGASIEKERRARGVYPPKEIYTPSNEDSQRCFQEYMADAQARMAKGQLKPGEDVRVVDNKVQVSGQVAVMAINALLTKVIFDKNPNNDFFVEESFPLDWMYPHLTPYGIIMKINREPLREMTDDVVKKDHEFWSDYSERLIGNWITYDTPISNITQFAEKVYVRKDYSGFQGDTRFARDDDGQKAFSKLRSSIAGVYAWRVSNGAPSEQARMLKEAEFAFKQAYAFCPYSPEALYRFVNLLVGMRRFDDAFLLAETSKKLDPANTQLDRLVEELQRLRSSNTGPAAAAQTATIAKLEADFRANPVYANAATLVQAYASMGQTGGVTKVCDDIVKDPKSDATMINFAMQIYAQLANYAGLEQALARWTQLNPTPEAWLDLAAAQAVQNKTSNAMASLRRTLALNAERLKASPGASNIALTLGTDNRFGSLQNLPEFKELLATNK